MLTYPQDPKITDYLIHIGTSKIRLFRNEGRWGETQPGWSVYGHSGWLDQDTWAKVEDYQIPPELDPISKEWYKVNKDNYRNFGGDDTALSKEIKRKLDLAGSQGTCWQLNLITPETVNNPPDWSKPLGMGENHDWIRVVTYMGEPKLRPWGW